MKRFLGALLLLGAAALAFWMAYDLWAGGFQHWERLGALGFCSGLATVGLMWLTGSRPDRVRHSETQARPSTPSHMPVNISHDDSFPVNDLDKVSGAGWCLALASVAPMIAVIAVGAFFLGESADPHKGKNSPMLLVLVGAFLVFFTCYQVGKRLLWKYGLTVRRREKAPREFRSPPSDADPIDRAGKSDGRFQSSEPHSGKHWRDGAKDSLIKDGQ
jgi:hypothetical protein